MVRISRHSRKRRGAVAVEAAIILPLLVGVMFGIWEVGRMVQIQQIMTNAAREGARLASGGYVNGDPVTAAEAKQAVCDYLTGAGFPSTAVSGAVVTLTNQSSHSWNDPSDAQPLDAFQISLTIPSGAPFDSLRLSSFNLITSTNSLSVTVNWRSMKDSLIVVSSSLPL